MEGEGMDWEGMRRDGMEWNGMRRNGMGWNEVGWDEMRWNEIGWVAFLSLSVTRHHANYILQILLLGNVEAWSTRLLTLSSLPEKFHATNSL